MSQKKPTFDLPVNIRSSYIVRDIFSNAIILDRDIAIRNTMAKTLGLKTSSTDNKRGVIRGGLHAFINICTYTNLNIPIETQLSIHVCPDHKIYMTN